MMNELVPTLAWTALAASATNPEPTATKVTAADLQIFLGAIETEQTSDFDHILLDPVAATACSLSRSYSAR